MFASTSPVRPDPLFGDHAGTVAAAFGGDEAAFAAVNPLDVLATRRSRTPRATWSRARRTTRTGRRLVRGSPRPAGPPGMDVQLHVLPGGHTLEVWGPALTDALPWLGSRQDGPHWLAPDLVAESVQQLPYDHLCGPPLPALRAPAPPDQFV